MKSVYLWLDLLTILFPLVFSFEKRLKYYRKWPSVFLSIIPFAIIFILWDIFAVSAGHWSFNPEFVGKITLFALPLEEILFFFCIPFSCIFIYECVSFVVPDKTFRVSRFIWIIPALISSATAFIFREKGYTFLAFSAFSLFFLSGTFFFPQTLASSRFWLANLAILIPFCIINGILTALPVVRYSPEHITGFRIGTIPVEDFFYNLVLIGGCIVLYSIFRKSKRS